MALAKKCDRCGAYYDSNTRLIKKGRNNSTPFIRIGVMTKDNIDEIFDLCDMCFESFYEWINLITHKSWTCEIKSLEEEE